MRKIKYKYLATQVLLLTSLSLGFAEAARSSKSQISTAPSPAYLDQLPANDYIIGEGDLISIIVSRLMPEISGNYYVDGSGTISLPILNRVYVSGLTIHELKNILNEKYLDYVKEPNVVIEITQYRPIRVYIDGEVESPGMHTLLTYTPAVISQANAIRGFKDFKDFKETTRDVIGYEGVEAKERKNRTDRTRLKSSGVQMGNNLEGTFPFDSYPEILIEDTANLNKLPKNTYLFPTVFDAIRKAGGVTFFSDLSNITLTRQNSISKGGGRIQTNLDFVKVMEEGDSSQNIRIYDGDVISIRKSEKPFPGLLTKAIKSNLNPKFINVFVSGKVEEPGTITVSKASSLTDAIDLAGGTKVLKGPIRFIRFKSDGSIDRRKFGFTRNRAMGTYRNPYLQSGDIIFVGKSAFNIATEIVTELTQPFIGLYSTYNLMKVANN